MLSGVGPWGGGLTPLSIQQASRQIFEDDMNVFFHLGQLLNEEKACITSVAPPPLITLSPLPFPIPQQETSRNKRAPVMLLSLWPTLPLTSVLTKCVYSTIKLYDPGPVYVL